MLSIAICDDDPIFAESLKREISNYLANMGYSKKIDVYGRASDMIKVLDSLFYDVLFLDIEIGDKSGIDIGRALRETYENSVTAVVFVSSHEKYHLSYQLYDAEPIGFLTKPVCAQKLRYTLDKILKRMGNKEHVEEMFLYSFGAENYTLLVKDIYYFRTDELDPRRKYIVTQGAEYPYNSSFKKIIKGLNNKDFIVVHQSYLVNAQHIIHYSSTEVVMRDNVAIQFSVRKKKAAMEQIKHYWQRRGSV